MRHILVALGLLLSTSAFAAAKAPQGNGNFRRNEVIKAAGVDAKLVTKVRGVTSESNFIGGVKLPKGSRLMLVEHRSGPGTKKFLVTAIKAPLDRNLKPTKMTKLQMHRAGLITEAEGAKLASKNGGILGSKGKVKLVPVGLSERGSYEYRQDKAVTYAGWGGSKYKAGTVYRTVTITGTGEAATAADVKQVKAPKFN